MAFLFSLNWWLYFFIALIGLFLSNFSYVYKKLIVLKTIGYIGIILLLFSIIMTIIK